MASSEQRKGQGRGKVTGSQQGHGKVSDNSKTIICRRKTKTKTRTQQHCARLPQGHSHFLLRPSGKEGEGGRGE